MATVAKLPPADFPEVLYSIETEALLLGALMCNERMIDSVLDRVNAEDFYEPVFGRLFQLIASEHAAGRSTAPFALVPLFRDDPACEQMGGPGFIAKLTGDGRALLIDRRAADTVADLAKRRRLYSEMQRLVADVVTIADNPVEELVERIDTTLSDALQRSESTSSCTFATAFDRTLKLIEAEAAGELPSGVRIDGLEDWNELLGGMRAGEITILGARPGMGKTAVALAVATGAARAGHGTLLVSLEMKMDELVKRSIADLLWDQDERAPSFEHVKKGYFNTFDKQIIEQVRDRITDWPLILTDPSKLKIGRLAMSIRRYQRQLAAKGKTLQLVVLDYLGLIKPDQRGASRYEAIGEISRTIKEVAKECGVHIVMLAQLNRECEKREDKRPQLADLRDSGDIEQDADNIVFLYREQYYLEKAEPDRDDKKRADWELEMAAARDRVEIIVAKRRNGKTGKRLCYFYADRQAVRGSAFNRSFR